MENGDVILLKPGPESINATAIGKRDRLTSKEFLALPPNFGDDPRDTAYILNRAMFGDAGCGAHN